MANQQYDNLPPPPPRAPAHRRPVSMVQVPSITTNIARTLATPSHTPISQSATTLGHSGAHSFSPYTPSSLNPRSPGGLAPPGSAVSPRSSPMEPYNPRQWSNRGPVSGSQMVFQQRSAGTAPSTRDVTGMEGSMPSPPPPYSPETPESAGQGVRISLVTENLGFTASPLQADTSTHNSPQVPMSPVFPPPPSQSSKHRDRSTSGIANQFGFFGLSGLRTSKTSNEVPTRSSIHIPETCEPEPRPPGARRAASTGQLPASTSTSAAAAAPLGSGKGGRGSPDNSWQPGMPLPGPPPGPPPAELRSQSLNRYPSSRSGSQTSENGVDVPQPSRRLAIPSNLGPIPPTPADWVDTDAIQVQQDRATLPRGAMAADCPPLRIDTGSNQDTSLARRPAKRDGSAQGIRERRSRSRAQDRNSKIISTMSDDFRPSDIVFQTAEGSIRRRREHMRTISGFNAESTAQAGSSSTDNATHSSNAPFNATNNVLTPPYTPWVEKANDDVAKKQPLKVAGDASTERPVSHILHQPVEDSSEMPAPLTPSRPPSSSSAKVSAKLDTFALQGIERHRAFVERELSAKTDEERLELFANYIVHESRLRRDRYSNAYNAMAGDVVDMTRDLWRSYTRSKKRAGTPNTSMSSLDPTIPVSGSEGRPTSAYGNGPDSASSFGDYTPATDAASAYDTMDGVGMERSDSRAWGDAFKPSLSPIPSMNVSTANDNDDGSSRGRTASRWWENSNSGSDSIGKPDRIQKSHRETKYMGVNPASLQESNHPSPNSSGHTGSTPGPSSTGVGYGPNEYPPEKVGLLESTDTETPIPTPKHPRNISTLGANSLDVSRLVTLPPPYPRHYPALNNKHPQLSELRNEHRTLVDFNKIQEIRDAYLDQDYAILHEQQEAAKERRATLRSSIQDKIADGTISFAEAAQAESDFDSEEAERGKANARSNFDVFEANLAHPLNSLVTERLEKANACINQLRAELESRNEVSDPNQAQEEGDEQPERLEKLTLLKWLFEVREQLHKEMFDLHADRSAKYSEVILTPYRIAKMQAKIDEATTFFSKDNQDRQMKFAKEGLRRFEDLQQVMELNVSRGVEDQLSAFWDIAPGLLEVIHHIPLHQISDLEIRIPEQEYVENPSYERYPLQYLYSLLSHAGKSAYQFIESQINLLCLLHEVRTATTKSRLRLLEVERSAASPDDEVLRAEMQAAKRAQEEQLTADLKEKVGEVERQWREALGDGLEECRGRVRGWLEDSGGWEDGLED